jgi:hypothetical protein
MKKMKKITVLFIAFVFLISLTFENLTKASAATVKEENINGYDVQYIKDTPDYQKIKFTNLETKEIEIVESKMVDGNRIFTAKSKDEQVQITRELNKLKVTNENTGKAEYTDLGSPSDSDVQSISINGNVQGIVPMDIPNDGDIWRYETTWKGSRGLDVTGASAIAGIIASIYGGPITGVVTSIATFYASYKAKNIWWICDLYSDYSNYYHMGESYSFYRYPDYTNYINETWREYYIK